ncbi:Nucleobase-ascorbate transporter 3 [Dichanthelium oligosanthes]|uniref:Nucleobase-ascorbate transporter 3 n=1 Tax=Dichanthelium oligosanthes TaxID=888268 RepID=A0A1E5WFN6_9POAL|nr:Nucleobase-ascorbate transporter 3 [Dichanthelium oligosanthes]
MGEMNQPPPPQVAAPPPMMPMPTMMMQPVGAGAIHPPHEQFNHLAYCVHSNPSWVQVAALAFLHYLVMLGSTVMLASIIVPKMGGNAGDKARVIQSFLFMSGINTLLQTLIGTRLPTIMNASFAFVVPVLSIAREVESNNFTNDHQRFVHTMRTTQGALIVASILNMILGFSTIWGAYTKKFSPVIMTPVVCVVGLGLFELGFPQVGKCVEIGLPMLILAVIVQQYVPHYFHHVHERITFLFERYSLLLCIGIVWAFAAILTAAGAYNHVSLKTQQHCRTDRSFLMSSAPWIKIPYPFQWGTPIFTAGHSFGMMGAVLVAAFEGIGMFLEGIFGAPAGSSVSVENIGLLGLTKVGSRRVIQISTGFMIFFSIFGKFGAFFASIPLPIFAAIYCILFGIVAAVGVSFMQFANKNSMRNIYIIGLSLFLGISVPQYFNEYTSSAGRGPARTNAGWFNDIINTVFASGPTVALIVASILDNTLEARGFESDRGLSWFTPFLRRSKGYSDPRNEEFYSFPIRVHNIIPSRFL